MDRAATDAEQADAVRAQIEFLKRTPGRPFSYGHEPGADDPPPTAAFELLPVDIYDARRARSPLSLDRNGATLVTHRSAIRDFYDEDELVAAYYPEAAERRAAGVERLGERKSG